VKEPKPLSPDDRLSLIYAGQHELLTHFNSIERTTIGLGDVGTTLNLQTYSGQARLRDFIGRVSEEIGEVVRCETPADLLEEIVDVLSFLIEIFHMIQVDVDALAHPCGMHHDSLVCVYSRAQDRVLTGHFPVAVDMHWETLLIQLWIWAHELKAKPWKLQPKITDERFFRERAGLIFNSFIACCYCESITDEELFNAYQRKHAINLARIARKE
jgi:dUTPase